MWNLVRLFLRNLFYQKKKITVKKKIDLTRQDRIGYIVWYKCECECKSMATFAESFCCRDTNEIPDENFKGKSNSKAVIERCLHLLRIYTQLLNLTHDILF